MKFLSNETMSGEEHFISSINNSRSPDSENWLTSSALMNLDEFLEQVAYHDNLSGNSKMRCEPVVRVDFR